MITATVLSLAAFAGVKAYQLRRALLKAPPVLFAGRMYYDA
jgi:hypothetical protein